MKKINNYKMGKVNKYSHLEKNFIGKLKRKKKFVTVFYIFHKSDIKTFLK